MKPSDRLDTESPSSDPTQDLPDVRPPCRLLLVGRDDGWACGLEALLMSNGNSLSITRVEDFLMALGHLGRGWPEDQPRVLIGRLADLETPAASTATALRRLAPKTKLLLVAARDRESQARAALAGGFDQYLVEPVDPASLAGAIDAVDRDEDGGDDRVWPGMSASGDHRTIAGVADLLDEEAEEVDATRLSMPDHELGDIDLIDHLLNRCEPIGALAVKLVAGHSRIPGIQWSDPGRPIPADRVAVAVKSRGTVFGVLHAPAPAAKRDLEPWAQWLGRWMGLEQRLDKLWELAVHDELTGLWNRRYLDRFLRAILERARHERFQVTVLVFDIDNFKIYNDRYGHAAGDEILREAGRLMSAVVREHDVVARIGGDEFAVVFWDAEQPRRPHSEHPATIRRAAQRFQRAICRHQFPKLAEAAPGNLTISGGLASFPWDGQTPDQLLKRADEMALRSKRQGKNVITFGPDAMKTCEQLYPEESPSPEP